MTLSELLPQEIRELVDTPEDDSSETTDLPVAGQSYYYSRYQGEHQHRTTSM